MLCDACERFRFPDNFTFTTTTTGDVNRDPIATSSELASAGTRKLVMNEVMTYLSFYRNSGNMAEIKKTLRCFFMPEEVTNAKQMLVNNFEEQLKGSVFVTRRRESSARSQQIAEIDDIVGACDYLDKIDVLKEVQFVACKLDRLPKCGPEELNLYSLGECQISLDNRLTALQQVVSDIDLSCRENTDTSKVCQRIDTLASRLDQFDTQISTHLDHVQQICSKAVNHVQQISTRTIESIAANPTLQAHPKPDHSDRSMNVILFGIKEDKDFNIWRAKVDEVFQKIAGRTIESVDMFRLGRFNIDKNRPILIRLRSTWDGRILMNGSRVLKGSGVFISRDEPLEVRRQSSMERLKWRAEHDGKQVVIEGDQLLVDGVAVFSLSRGFLSTNHPQSNG